MKRSRVSRLLACFLANVMAIVVFSSTAIAQHVLSDRASVGSISGGGGIYPTVTKELIIDPAYDVAEGEEQYFSIWLKDPVGIAGAKTIIKTDKEDEIVKAVIELQLAEGTAEEGRWEGTWITENIPARDVILYYLTDFWFISKDNVERQLTVSSWYPVPNLPPAITQFQGPTQGLLNEVLAFSVKVVDPEADQVSVRFKWGTGSSQWSEYQSSGSIFDLSCSWQNPGTYNVQVQVKDFLGAESEWSEPITVTITETTTPPNLPPTITQFQGPTQGLLNEVLAFSVRVVDPEADQVSVRFEWGNGSSSWSEYQPSGSVLEISHSWQNPGTYSIQGQARDYFGNIGTWYYLEVTITEVVTPPNLPPTITQFQGPTQGLLNEVLAFSVKVVDPEADQVSVRFEWGNSQYSEWSGYQSSGSTFELSYSWSSPGTYSVQIKAKDYSGAESDWIGLTTVTVTEVVTPPNLPPAVSQFQGPSEGYVNDELTFSATAVDPEGDAVFVRFKTDYISPFDSKPMSQISSWLGYQPSGSVFEIVHCWHIPVVYHVSAQAKDSSGAESEWSSSIAVTITEVVTPPNLPPAISQFQGPSQCLVNEVLAFSVRVVDPEADQVSVRFGWDNGQYSEFLSEWSGYQPSGSVFEVSHSWSSPGTYSVQVQARNFCQEGTLMCDWSSSLTIVVSNVIVSVGSGSEIPRTFVLSQNYPNPFNPITEITFGLPEDSHITLAVFNSLGQQIAVLADGQRGAGQHRVIWDGAGFPNGVYFYRLSAKGFAETRKMLLLK